MANPKSLLKRSRKSPSRQRKSIRKSRSSLKRSRKSRSSLKLKSIRKSPSRQRKSIRKSRSPLKRKSIRKSPLRQRRRSMRKSPLKRSRKNMYRMTSSLNNHVVTNHGITNHVDTNHVVTNHGITNHTADLPSPRSQRQERRRRNHGGRRNHGVGMIRPQFAFWSGRLKKNQESNSYDDPYLNIPSRDEFSYRPASNEQFEEWAKSNRTSSKSSWKRKLQERLKKMFGHANGYQPVNNRLRLMHDGHEEYVKPPKRGQFATKKKRGFQL